MSHSRRMWAATMVAVVLVSPSAGELQAQDKASHRHISHAADGWRDTPDGMGLLPAAKVDAEIAAQHARLAAARLDDLSSMQTHTQHVVSAMAPDRQAGPGKYGLVKAAEGAAAHIKLAADADDASDNVKLHATHVHASALNAAKWGGEILELAEKIAAAADAASAAGAVGEVQALTAAILAGVDANGDGAISWSEGEGGLEQAFTHLGLMKRGEGLP